MSSARKYLMCADAQETGITPHLCMDGYQESWITIALACTLRPGWHCLHVGANHGYYTLIMADAVGREGRVVPVEPTPGSPTCCGRRSTSTGSRA